MFIVFDRFDTESPPEHQMQGHLHHSVYETVSGLQVGRIQHQTASVCCNCLHAALLRMWASASLQKATDAICISQKAHSLVVIDGGLH